MGAGMRECGGGRVATKLWVWKPGGSEKNAVNCYWRPPWGEDQAPSLPWHPSGLPKLPFQNHLAVWVVMVQVPDQESHSGY